MTSSKIGFSISRLNKILFVVSFLGFGLVGCNKETPKDMVYIPSGSIFIFNLEKQKQEEVEIRPFYLDKSPVTFEAFDRFVKEYRYKTQAEEFGNSMIFDFEQGLWKIKDNINYKYPNDSSKTALGPNHPVTQVSWNDANYYCNCQGKRLPTNAEWEYASKNANKEYDLLYAWGEKDVVGKQYKANYWQGVFPYKNTVLDGFKYTSPVGHFGETKLGLTDMGGNVWEWCSDDISPSAEEAFLDSNMRKVLRGGSFLCDPNVCHGYTVEGKSSSTPETSTSHIGFRCAKDED